VVPGNAAPREAACAPVPPTDWFGTILGRVIGNWAFARDLWVALRRAARFTSDDGRAKTTKVKMRGPRLVKAVSGHLEWPLRGQNRFHSPDWPLTSSL